MLLMTALPVEGVGFKQLVDNICFADRVNEPYQPHVATWIAPELIQLNPSHYSCRCCHVPNCVIHFALCINSIYYPIGYRCAEKINKIFTAAANHYSYIFYVLRHYTINDIARYILYNLARPS